MHPRNPYTEGLDFAELALRFPTLQPYVNKNGRIDFMDPMAQRMLTKALLKTDFGLDVELPSGRLCPPVPNRLNYVLWIEDIAEAARKHKALAGHFKANRIRGLDVGTGASAIYPLLCCKQNPEWEMLATEIDDTSLTYAQKNVSMNRLDERIHIYRATTDPPSPSSHIFGPLFADPNLEIDFTMCNPPFYSSASDIQSAKEEKDSEAFSTCTGSTNEMIYPPSTQGSVSTPNFYASCRREGGEVGFVAQMVEESLVLRWRCGWYTSMLGKMSSVPKIVALLKASGITNYAITQFVQGQTRRWAIAWSVDDWYRLPDCIARLSHLPSTHALAKVQPARTTLEHSFDEDPTSVIRGILEGMRQGETLEVDEASLSPEEANSVVAAFVVRAKNNTWSRAARRKMTQKEVAERPGTEGPVGTGSSAEAENTLKRKRPNAGHGRDEPALKKERHDGFPSSSSQVIEEKEYKMACSVTVSVQETEGDTTPRRWVLGVQWLYGRDEQREMFEGFANHVERKVANCG